MINRIRHVQNRTRYYTIRDVISSISERPKFVVDEFRKDKQLSIRKAFLSRRDNRIGPFRDLNEPHIYSGIYGDPNYYSHDELVRTCVHAADNQRRNYTFWKQICERLRCVRDVLDVCDLLACLSSVSRVDYYDRDLMRMLVREFVDDVDRLSLEDLDLLLSCYYKFNVHSYSLVSVVGDRIISALDGDTFVKPLDTIVKYLTFFNYDGIVQPAISSIKSHHSEFTPEQLLKLYTYLSPSLSEDDSDALLDIINGVTSPNRVTVTLRGGGSRGPDAIPLDVLLPFVSTLKNASTFVDLLSSSISRFVGEFSLRGESIPLEYNARFVFVDCVIRATHILWSCGRSVDSLLLQILKHKCNAQPPSNLVKLHQVVNSLGGTSLTTEVDTIRKIVNHEIIKQLITFDGESLASLASTQDPYLSHYLKFPKRLRVVHER